MKQINLKFDSMEQSIKFLTENGFIIDEYGKLQKDDAFVDVIGLIPKQLVTNDYGEIVDGGFIDGWHVNILVYDNFSLNDDSYVIHAKTPYRVFYGI